MDKLSINNTNTVIYASILLGVLWFLILLIYGGASNKMGDTLNPVSGGAEHWLFGIMACISILMGLCICCAHHFAASKAKSMAFTETEKEMVKKLESMQTDLEAQYGTHQELNATIQNMEENNTRLFRAVSRESDVRLQTVDELELAEKKHLDFVNTSKETYEKLYQVLCDENSEIRDENREMRALIDKWRCDFGEDAKVRTEEMELLTAEKDRKIDEQSSSPGSPSSVGYNSTTASTAAPDSDKKLQSSLEREKQLRAKIDAFGCELAEVQHALREKEEEGLKREEFLRKIRADNISERKMMISRPDKNLGAKMREAVQLINVAKQKRGGDLTIRMRLMQKLFEKQGWTRLDDSPVHQASTASGFSVDIQPAQPVTSLPAYGGKITKIRDSDSVSSYGSGFSLDRLTNMTGVLSPESRASRKGNDRNLIVDGIQEEEEESRRKSKEKTITIEGRASEERFDEGANSRSIDVDEGRTQRSVTWREREQSPHLSPARVPESTAPAAFSPGRLTKETRALPSTTSDKSAMIYSSGSSSSESDSGSSGNGSDSGSDSGSDDNLT